LFTLPPLLLPKVNPWEDAFFKASERIFGGFFYVNPLLFPQSLAQDVDPTQAKITASTQKPTSQSILAEKSGPPAWKQLPTWYQISENDRIIPPAAQHMFAKQMNATTISLPL
jgi:hypothetical protein